MKMWRTRRWGDEPEEVEVDRFTDKTVWLTGKTNWGGQPGREARFSSYQQFYETREDAIEAIRRRLSKRVESARHEIERGKTDLAEAQSALAAFNATHPEQPNA